MILSCREKKEPILVYRWKDIDSILYKQGKDNPQLPSWIKNYPHTLIHDLDNSIRVRSVTLSRYKELEIGDYLIREQNQDYSNLGFYLLKKEAF